MLQGGKEVHKGLVSGEVFLAEVRELHGKHARKVSSWLENRRAFSYAELTTI